MTTIKKILHALFLSIPMLSTSILSHAAKPWDEAEDEHNAAGWMTSDSLNASQEMDSGIYGRVVSVDPVSGELSLFPADTVENEESEDATGGSSQSFKADSKTTYTGVGSLKDIAPGDYLTVDYHEFNGASIIEGIVFEKAGDEHYAGEKTKPFPQKDLVDIPVNTDAAQDTGTKNLIG